MSNTTDSRHKKRLRKTKAQLIEELEALEQAFAEREQSQQQPDVKYQEDRRQIDTLHIQASALAKIGYWVFDHQNPEKHYWSEGMVDIFGVMPNKTGEFFLTATNNEMIHVEDLARVLKTFKSFETSGEYFDIQYRIIRNDGEIRWLREIGQGIEWRGQHCLRSVGTVQDITELRLKNIDRLRSEEELELAQRISNVGSYRMDFESDFMISFSAQMAKIYGMNAEAISAMDDQYMSQVIHIEDRERVVANYRSAKFKENCKIGEMLFEIEYRILRPDGEVRHIHERTNVSKVSDGRVIELVGTMQDITERKFADAALTEKRLQLQSILDFSPVTISIKDMQGNYVLVNKQQENLFNIPVQDMEGENIKNVLPKSLLKSALAHEKEVIKTLQPSVREHQFHVDDQHFTMLTSKFLILDDEQKPTGIGTMAMDVTEIKQMEAALIKSKQELRDSEANFRAVVEQAGDAFFLIDTKTAKFKQVNNQACRALGYGQDELLMLSFPEVDQSFPIEKFIDLIDSLSIGVPVTIETILIRKDGTTFPVEIRTGLIEVYEDTCLLALVRDISERKEAEQQLELMQQGLIRNERLATLGQLTATVSHELRNPLGAMRPSLYLLQKNLPTEDERLNAAFDRLDRNIDRCDRIIDQMLDFTRIKGINRRLLDLDKWLADELDELNVPKGVRIEREFYPGASPRR